MFNFKNLLELSKDYRRLKKTIKLSERLQKFPKIYGNFWKTIEAFKKTLKVFGRLGMDSKNYRQFHKYIFVTSSLHLQ